MENNIIIALAAAHGLQLQKELTFNEMGADFKVAFATDSTGRSWVLRIPRRKGLVAQINREAQILRLVKVHLPVAVPDWQIATSDLVAYPLLADKPAITYDPVTYAVTWNIPQAGSAFTESLAKVLVQLHQIPQQKAEAIGLPPATPESLRQAMQEKLDTVKRELDIPTIPAQQWQRWIDDDHLWPRFTTFIHGDLFAGHTLAKANGEISGIIDWSEGQVGDPAADFAGHASVFGTDSVQELLSQYERFGGNVWPGMLGQIIARHAATPLAYAYFAVANDLPTHIEAAKAQLAAL